MDSDTTTVERLRQGDEGTFLALVRLHHRRMLSLARSFLASEASAEDVVQETWAAVVTGIGRFEGRSSLRAWIFAILKNLARTQAKRAGALREDEPLDDSADFHPSAHPRWGGHWSTPPTPWPDDALTRASALQAIGDAIARLPAGQRAVIELRDVEGWTAEEVCAALDLTSANQRVLLHRARTRVRREIARAVEHPAA